LTLRPERRTEVGTIFVLTFIVLVLLFIAVVEVNAKLFLLFSAM
jgi:hypothetical protein